MVTSSEKTYRAIIQSIKDRPHYIHLFREIQYTGVPDVYLFGEEFFTYCGCYLKSDRSEALRRLVSDLPFVAGYLELDPGAERFYRYAFYQTMITPGIPLEYSELDIQYIEAIGKAKIRCYLPELGEYSDARNVFYPVEESKRLLQRAVQREIEKDLCTKFKL